MRPAADAMEEALSKVAMHAPVVPLVANVVAKPISDPEEIRRRLIEQVTGMVRWTESVRWMTTEGGVTDLVELGAGKVLSGLAKRISPIPRPSPSAPGRRRRLHRRPRCLTFPESSSPKEPPNV